jgi:hypothetical protein
MIGSWMMYHPFTYLGSLTSISKYTSLLNPVFFTLLSNSMVKRLPIALSINFIKARVREAKNFQSHLGAAILS